MYCPNCGQQQLSGEMRFCSRCGLALSGLTEWLAGNVVPIRVGDEVQTAATSPRRQGMQRAAKLMFFSGVLFPVFLLLSLAIHHGELMIFPVALFFVSVVLMLYTYLFSDKTAPVVTHAPQGSTLGAMSSRSTLPPPGNMPIPAAGRQQVRTNELAQPPSVTEHTTRFLDNE